MAAKRPKPVAKHPGDRDIVSALMTFARDAGDLATALAYAEQLARLAPDNPNIAKLVQDLRRERKEAGGQ